MKSLLFFITAQIMIIIYYKKIRKEFQGQFEQLEENTAECKTFSYSNRKRNNKN